MAARDGSDVAGALKVRSGHRQSSPRACRSDEADRIHDIINAAAHIYRGVIAPDCWHEQYMSKAALLAEMASGVVFWGLETDGGLTAVMGIQRVADVSLIRHAYVLPGYQNMGAGGTLLDELRRQTATRLLVGTWTAATWAVAFYVKNGFGLVEPAQAATLLRQYWTVSDRQIEASSVLVAQSPVQKADLS